MRFSSRMKLDGHVIDHAETIRDVTAYSDTENYDLILLDIMLPDGDGRDFLKQHREGKKDTPVIVLTVRSQARTESVSSIWARMTTSPSRLITPNSRPAAVPFYGADMERHRL